MSERRERRRWARGFVALLWALIASTAACIGPRRDVAAQYAIDPRPQTFSRMAMSFGYRGFDDSWEPFDDQFAFQMTGGHEWRSSPVGIEYGFGLGLDDDDVRNAGYVTSTSIDLSLGPTHTFSLDHGGRWFLNVGGGGQITFVEQDATNSLFGEDDDEWFGGYVHTCLYWRAGWNWDVGFDVRWVKGEDVDLSGSTQDGEYLQLALGTGFSW